MAFFQLPDKSIACLVKYYYSWKKTRSRTSLMDRQARKLTSSNKDGENGSENGSELGSNTDSESEDKVRISLQSWLFYPYYMHETLISPTIFT